jgi:hypothetical protein
MFRLAKTQNKFQTLHFGYLLGIYIDRKRLTNLSDQI